MSLSSRFSNKRPPHGLLEFPDRVYVFDSCFGTEVLTDGLYKTYLQEIINDLHKDFPKSSFLAFDFREEDEKESIFAETLGEHDVTVLSYPRQYHEGCPLLPLSLIQHFLSECETWLDDDHHHIILLHCERGGWPLLAFLLASLVIFMKVTGYFKIRTTLESVYREAPKGLLQLLSPLINPFPSQPRYLQYVARTHVYDEWPISERALSLDNLIIRDIPNFDSQHGCRPIIRIFGRKNSSSISSSTSSLSTEMLYSMSDKKLRHYRQAECDVIKFDIECWVQGDVVLECVHLDLDAEREVMMFRLMFNTALVESNLLMLDLDALDILWEAKDLYPKGFRVENFFEEVENASPVKLPTSEFPIEELFSGEDLAENGDDASLPLLKQLSITKEFTSFQDKGSSYLNFPHSEDETNTSSDNDEIEHIPISFAPGSSISSFRLFYLHYHYHLLLRHLSLEVFVHFQLNHFHLIVVMFVFGHLELVSIGVTEIKGISDE